MRDQFAPMIEGFDLNGIVDPYSFQCTPFYIEGDNGGTLMDGTTIHDILEEKVRLSWTFNALYLNQYIALSDALNSGESPDTVTVYAYDLTRNAVILAKFHASLPEFNFVSAYGQTMGISNGELVLEEAELLAWFSVTPPNKSTYARGESLDFTGLTVTQYDKDGNGVDITAQCNISTVDEVELLTEGDMTVPVPVTLPSGFELIFDWNITVTPPVPIASGDWWTLYKKGLLDVFCEGDMPNYSSSSPPPWIDYQNQIVHVKIEDGVTSIGERAFYEYTGLNEITFSSTLLEIGARAFMGCTSITNVDFPFGLRKILQAAFAGCTGLRQIIIPDSVNIIESNAFISCVNLEKVKLPNSSYNTIRYWTFGWCGKLSTINIPNNIRTIQSYAFQGCSGLSNIYYSGTEAQRGAMIISSNNAPLLNATWHYESTGPDY